MGIIGRIFMNLLKKKKEFYGTSAYSKTWKGESEAEKIVIFKKWELAYHTGIKLFIPFGFHPSTKTQALAK